MLDITILIKTLLYLRSPNVLRRDGEYGRWSLSEWCGPVNRNRSRWKALAENAPYLMVPLALDDVLEVVESWLCIIKFGGWIPTRLGP